MAKISGNVEIALGIVLAILAFIIGLFGIAVFIGVGCFRRSKPTAILNFTHP